MRRDHARRRARHRKGIEKNQPRILIGPMRNSSTWCSGCGRHLLEGACGIFNKRPAWAETHSA